MKRYFFLLIILLSIPLMGSHMGGNAFGCSCGGGDGADGNSIPGGGAIAASATYAIDRASLGTSWGALTSSDNGYQMKATLGDFTSQGRTESGSYLIHQPMGREVVSGTSSDE